MLAHARTRTGSHHRHSAAHCAAAARSGRYRGAVQRLGVLVAVMLARERRAPTEAAVGCTPLAASLAALPSRPLELIAEAMAALGVADV